jgi:hypothetical protein
MPGQSPLPPKNCAAEPPALQVAKRIFDQKPTPIAQTDSNKEKTSFLFQRDTVLRLDAPASMVIRQYAFFGAYKLPPQSECSIMVLDEQKQEWQEDYRISPGSINPQLAALLSAAYQKAPTSHLFTNLQNFIREQCVTASHQTRENDAPECHINSRFLTTATIQAIQNMAFKPVYHGYQESDMKGILTAWSFIRSISKYAHLPNCRVPATGITATDAHDITCNILSMLHLLFQDHTHADLLGSHHSTF